MHTLAIKSEGATSPSQLVWRGHDVLRGDASAIATLTHFSRNYVDKVLRAKRHNELVESAALKFYQLRKEMLAV